MSEQEVIEKLTPEQETKFPEYVDKWIDIGTNTDRLDYDEVADVVDDFRELIEMEKVPLIIADNPIEAWVMCELYLRYEVPIEDLMTETEKVFNGNPEKYEISKAWLPFQSGSFMASIFSFYDFFFRETDVLLDDDLFRKYKIWERTVHIGPIYPLDTLTVVSQKPTKISLNEDNVLHCDGGPALEYDGMGDFKIYALNGVTVPEYLAVTPAHELDLEWYNKEQNADVKAEFVRKVGIERFLEQGTLIDSYENYDKDTHPWWYKSEYELWDMSFLFSTLDYAPYLKMKNQTTDVWHVEGVSPDCRDVHAAIKERFGGRDFVIAAIA